MKNRDTYNPTSDRRQMFPPTSKGEKIAIVHHKVRSCDTDAIRLGPGRRLIVEKSTFPLLSVEE